MTNPGLARQSTENLTCVSGMAALAWELPDEIAMYARIGVDLVGLPVGKVHAFGAERLIALLGQHGVRVGYLVHPFSAHPDDDALWADELSVLRAGVRDAQALGAEILYLTSGPSGDLDWEQAADRFAQRLAPIVELARSLGVRLALENTLPVKCDISFVHTARDAFSLARRIGIGVCLDLYCCWQERGLDREVSEHVGLIEILQVSDFVIGTSAFPNRWVPGDADLPLQRLLAQVLAAGYTGMVDAELIGPAIDAEGAESALTRSVAWMRTQVEASTG